MSSRTRRLWLKVTQVYRRLVEILGLRLSKTEVNVRLFFKTQQAFNDLFEFFTAHSPEPRYHDLQPLELSEDANTCKSCGSLVNVPCDFQNEDLRNGSEIMCTFCQHEIQLQFERKEAVTGIAKAAEKMVQSSKKKFPEAAIGAYVTIQVPKFDRGPLDLKAVHGQIVDFRNGVYRIGTSVGTLKNWYPRTEFQISQIKLTEKISNDSISLREAVTKLSLFGGQGFKKCSCKASQKQCQTAKCSCFKSKLLCNSRCHSSLTCANK